MSKAWGLVESCRTHAILTVESTFDTITILKFVPMSVEQRTKHEVEEKMVMAIFFDKVTCCLL